MRSLGNVDPSLKEQLKENFSTAKISDIDKVILTYVEKLTKEPSTITQDYIDKLKEVSLSEHAIHDIVQVASYFNYVNRLADGLGVELELE